MSDLETGAPVEDGEEVFTDEQLETINNALKYIIFEEQYGE